MVELLLPDAYSESYCLCCHRCYKVLSLLCSFMYSWECVCTFCKTAKTAKLPCASVPCSALQRHRRQQSFKHETDNLLLGKRETRCNTCMQTNFAVSHWRYVCLIVRIGCQFWIGWIGCALLNISSIHLYCECYCCTLIDQTRTIEVFAFSCLCTLNTCENKKVYGKRPVQMAQETLNVLYFDLAIGITGSVCA